MQNSSLLINRLYALLTLFFLQTSLTRHCRRSASVTTSKKFGFP
jgi:hypothetical protein